LSHRFASPWKPAALNSCGCCRNHAHTALSTVSSSGKRSPERCCYRGLLDVTGNVHRIWAAFLYGYPLLPYLLPTKKPHNATLFYHGTCTQGRRHFVTAAPSFKSCAYRSLLVTVKLDSAAI